MGVASAVGLALPYGYTIFIAHGTSTAHIIGTALAPKIASANSISFAHANSSSLVSGVVNTVASSFGNAFGITLPYGYSIYEVNGTSSANAASHILSEQGSANANSTAQAVGLLLHPGTGTGTSTSNATAFSGSSGYAAATSVVNADGTFAQILRLSLSGESICYFGAQTPTVGPLASSHGGSNVWKLSILIKRNIFGKNKQESRLLYTVAPEAGDLINFNISIDPQSGEIVAPSALIPRDAIIKDDIGIFGSKYWNSNNLNINISQNSDTNTTRLIDISPIFPGKGN